MVNEILIEKFRNALRGLGLFFLFSLLPTPYSLLPSYAGELDASFGPTEADERPSKPSPVATPEFLEAGKKIYNFRCAPCHGFNGAGDGPAAMTLDPRPRDFTRGLFKFKSTLSGEVVSDEDLFRTISRGIPNTAMPSWKKLLSEEQRWQVIAYIKTFSPRFKDAKPSTSLAIGQEPPMTPESIAKGKEIFHKKAQPVCSLCHGENGRGNGPLAPAVTNAWGEPLFPRNLTQPWTYKSGNTTRDIFIRDSVGIEGTPMPSYEKQLSEEERWQVAHYIRSLQKELQPESKVVIQSVRVPQEIPMDPNDPFWQGLDRVDLRMTGQVHVAPRNQNPTVSIVTLRSAYNEKEIAFQLEWDDRIKNSTHQENDVTSKWEVAEFATPYPVLYPPTVRYRNLRDAAALQFPVRIPEGPIKPHFFLGDVGKPVNLWYWKADTDAMEELNATGYKVPGKLQPSGSQMLVGKSSFEDGHWGLVMKRPLTTEDAANDIQFEPGRLIPVAVHVWDGANGETGLRRTISSWYFVVLETPVPTRVYLMTVVGVGVTVGLEAWLIRRAKRKKQGGQ
jgi:mono/diheme cytochrome c family protein